MVVDQQDYTVGEHLHTIQQRYVGFDIPSLLQNPSSIMNTFQQIRPLLQRTLMIEPWTNPMEQNQTTNLREKYIRILVARDAFLFSAVPYLDHMVRLYHFGDPFIECELGEELYDEFDDWANRHQIQTILDFYMYFTLDELWDQCYLPHSFYS